MDHIPDIDRRRDFSIWLRTGRPPTRTANAIELKFNPYHDPRNGQFIRPPRSPRGNNSRAFKDPMIIERTFSGLRDAPGSAVISLMDKVFGITAPRTGGWQP